MNCVKLYINRKSNKSFNLNRFLITPMSDRAHLFQPFEVVPEEGHGPIRPGRTQLDDAVLEQLLDVVLLDILLTLPETPLLLAA